MFVSDYIFVVFFLCLYSICRGSAQYLLIIIIIVFIGLHVTPGQIILSVQKFNSNSNSNGCTNAV